MKTLKTSSLITVMLVIILVLAAACNRDQGNDSGNVVPPTPALVDTPTPEPPPPPEPATEYEPATEEAPRISGVHQPRDLGGANLRVGGWWPGTLRFSVPIGVAEEPDPATAVNYFEARKIWDNARRAEAEFNFTLEEVLVDGMEIPSILTTTVMAGDPFADIVMANGNVQLPFAIGGLIHPLDTLNLPGSDLLGPRTYARISAEGFGHIWAFNSSAPSTSAHTMGINLDIINAIGAPNPLDLWEAGQWNWSAMLEIMRLATRDTTGDGAIDQWGFAGAPSELLRNLIAANDGILVTEDLNFGMDHPNTIEAMEFAEIIFREGLWETDPAMPVDVNDWGRNFWAFQNGNSALFLCMTWNMNDGNLPFEFAVVPIPLGPSNTSGSTFMGGWRQGLVLPHSSPWAPADILMVAEEYFAWPDDPAYLLGPALTQAANFFLTEGDALRQVNEFENMRMEMGYNIQSFMWRLPAFITHFIDQDMTVVQAIETYRGPMQEILDDFFRD
ncbi:MAG: extracellular solute-binding protein [Firmicutes bacterium]|nr:extracellular solute-binding protein [Bacillota bacterium]